MLTFADRFRCWTVLGTNLLIWCKFVDVAVDDEFANAGVDMGTDTGVADVDRMWTDDDDEFEDRVDDVLVDDEVNELDEEKNL